MRYYEDPILGKGRAADVSGGTGGTSYVGGERIAIAGETISFVNSATIQNVTGNSVTLEPDTAYKITATASAVTLNANVPAAGQWAYEGHAEIFVAGTGYIVTGSNVVLANALEPDSVNNCTVRFHDGIAIIAVEDHVAGYIVVNGATSGDGSLYYGIATSTNDYVAFDASLNGTTIPLAGAVANGEKHLVGNGYTSTTLTGAVDCGTSKFTVTNLGLNNVQITGGTMTLGDAYIPSGSTVAVSGGGLAIEKVTGAGSESVVDLGGTFMVISSGTSAGISGCSLTGGVASTGGVLVLQGSMSFSDCLITGNKGNIGGFMNVNVGNPYASFSGCTITGNTATNNGGGFYFYTGVVDLENTVVSGNIPNDIRNPYGLVNLNGGCTIGSGSITGGTVTFAGENTVTKMDGTGSAVISSGASINLTSSISLSGGIQVVGGCTVNSVTVEPDTYTSFIVSGGTTYINQ